MKPEPANPRFAAHVNSHRVETEPKRGNHATGYHRAHVSLRIFGRGTKDFIARLRLEEKLVKRRNQSCKMRNVVAARTVELVFSPPYRPK
jgi:hypothetical protein